MLQWTGGWLGSYENDGRIISQYSESQAYDLLPVNIVVPEDQEQLALTLNGKKQNIRRKDLLAFAENCSIPAKSANAMLNKLCSLSAADHDEGFLDQKYQYKGIKIKKSK